MCEDDPNWRDSLHGGDGTAGCVDMIRDWCENYGNYSDAAKEACPKTCGVCTPPGMNNLFHTTYCIIFCKSIKIRHYQYYYFIHIFQGAQELSTGNAMMVVAFLIPGNVTAFLTATMGVTRNVVSHLTSK